MTRPTAPAIVTGVLLLGAWVPVASPPLLAQATGAAVWNQRTPWGDPDLQGEWTSEGEYAVPLERPVQFGTRAFLTDAEYAKRLDDVRSRDERDLERVDVLSGKVDSPNAPIPHWREYNTTSRRTFSLFSAIARSRASPEPTARNRWCISCIA